MKTTLLLILILGATLLVRVIQLDHPNTYVFDEVYHAFTAKEYLKGNSQAWEWWTTPPPGVAFEWTHPPLAKEIMAVSMKILNSTDAWSFRLPGVLLGTLSTWLVFRLSSLLFKSDRIGLLSATVFALDGLNFVQSRTGMNDIYLTTFMLASVVAFVQKRYFISSAFFGLALSSKWAAIYLIIIYAILLLKRRGLSKSLYFLVVPPTIYLLTYLPFFMGHSFDQFLELQKQMWWYHTNLKASHAYASPWWSWPLNLNPVWYYVEYKGTLIANIFASGNPVIFWTGFAAITLLIIDYFKRKSEPILLILLGFFIFWLPWAISPRIMFLYHFLPSVPFLSIALGYQLNFLAEKKQNTALIILLILMIIGFLISYPILTGIFLPKNPF